MKRNFKIFLFVFALPIFAQQKIGYIDSQRILSEYGKAKEVKAEFEKKIQEWKKEINRRQEELEQLQKNLQTQSFMLTEEAKLRRMEEIQKKKAELDNYINEIYRKDGKAETLNKELMQPLIQKIDTVVSEIAKEEGFSLILDVSTGVVIYAEEMYDITNKVIEALNKMSVPEVVVGEKIEYYIFKFKEEDADSKSRSLGSRIKNLIFSSIKEGLGKAFEEIKSADLTQTKKSLAIEDEEEVSSNLSLATQFLNMSGITFVLIGRVWIEGGNILFEYSIVDRKKEGIVASENVEVGVEENLKERIVEKVLPKIAELYK
ncbi:MAG: OmpH family outer membrane protein [candidate division WOR-3 bacterium]